jgi:HEAT repeat protein
MGWNRRSSIALKVSILGLSLPLMLTSNAYARDCTAQIKEYVNDIKSRSESRVIETECVVEAVPALIEALEDGDDHVQSSAASFLAQREADAKEAVPAL